ncbi:T9SS type A sorting domain-containing protein [Kaistella sp.]|uniref:T9SS type A sorting domain-containing protein n=1 Tax=Kaistella sp. TaxID=2782235 RepID=UPI003C63EA59
MNKFYLTKLQLFVFLLFTANAFSQSIIVNHPPNPSTAINSSIGNDNKGIFSADSFSILQGSLALGELTLYGADGIGGLEEGITGFNIYIFKNNINTPLGNPSDAADAVYAIKNIPLSAFTWEKGEGMDFKFTIPMTAANGGNQVVLNPGEYWLSAFPTVGYPVTQGAFWHWYGSAGASNESVFIDPDNLANGGFTQWTQLSTILGYKIYGLAWKLTNEALLGVEPANLASVSVYPNPVKDVLNITSQKKVESVDVFNLTGQKVINNTRIINNQINLSNLISGTYFFRIILEGGKIETVKIIKN